MKKTLFFLVIALSISTFAQVDINVKIKGINDTIAILGYHFGDKQYVSDTFRVEKSYCHIKKSQNYPEGMYFLLFPQNKNRFFDFILDDNQKFTIISDTADLYLKNMKIKHSLANKELLALNHKFKPINVKFEIISKQLKESSTSKQEKDSLLQIVKKLENEKDSIIVESYYKAKSRAFKNMLGVLMPIKTPDFKLTDNVQNKDSLIRIKEYYYYKNHYWDYVNFNDSSIVRTPFFQPKFEKYISKVIAQNPDTVLAEGLKLIEKSKNNIALYSYLINYMLVYNEKSKRMGMDKVFVEIAKQYYQTGKATWADSAYKAKVLDKMKRTENNLIGNKAHNLANMQQYKGGDTSLYNLKNKYVIIVFWSPTCGHCKREIPELHEIYNDLKTKGVDIQVFAVLDGNNLDKWKKFIEDKKINDWVNVYDKNNSSYFGYYYDVYYTPTVYLLGENKEILAKRLSPKQLKDYILYLNNKK